jgi:hypothetical protein
MNWFSQVRHVVAKDVRRTRWALIVYIALIAASTASFVTGRAFGPYSPTPSTEVLGMPDIFVVYLPVVSVILGLVASASLLQLDSPTRANAFWASRPLSPNAVMSAKLTVVLVIVVVPLIGVIGVLRSLDTSAVAATKLIAACAVSYAEWALAVMLVGALTNDLRSSAVAFIAILFGIVLLAVAIGSYMPSSPLVPLAFTVGGAIGGVLLLSFLYRTRDKRLRTWIAAAVLTTCLIVASFSPFPMKPRAKRVGVIGPGLHVEPTDTATWGRTRQFSIRLKPSLAFSTADERVDFQADSVTIGLLDGTRINVAGYYPSTNVLLTPPQLGSPVRWRAQGEQDRAVGFLTVEPQESARAAISTGARSVSINGTFTNFRSRIVATLPLRVGASAIRDGRRIAIYGFSHDATGADVWVQVSSIPQASVLLGGSDDLQLAIVNEARSEAMLLTSRGNGGGSGGMVLPWLQLSTSFTHVTSNPSNAVQKDLPLDDAWYASAHLVVLEWDVVRRSRARDEVALR